jgi:hypothetical protein
MPASPNLLLLALALLAAVGCSTPRPNRQSPLAAAERVLALDFGAHANADRERSLAQMQATAAREVRRVTQMRPNNESLAHELARPTTAHIDAVALAKSELTRRPTVPASWRRSPQELAQALADALGALPTLVLPQRPLGEIDDAHHRTDLRDLHPEATLLERLRRRLHL